MKYLSALLILFSTSSAYALDEFGQRFGNQPPFALEDSLDPTSVIYIEPAAGADEEAPDETVDEDPVQKEDIKGRVYPDDKGPSIEVRSSDN